MTPHEREYLISHGGERAIGPVLDLRTRPAVHGHAFQRCNLCGQEEPLRLCPLVEECPLQVVHSEKVGLCLNCLALIKAGLSHAPDIQAE